MAMVHRILVGVDFAARPGGQPPACDAVAESASRAALWLAQRSGAAVTFLSVVPQAGAGETAAQQALADLVSQARAQGIAAEATTAVGPAWLEITRRVVRAGHDLVVVGTHDRHGLQRLVVGGTARKLLHECPCPVWVCKPGADAVLRRILVASDLSPLSDRVARLGLGLGQVAGAFTHLLDVVEYPLDRLWAPEHGDPDTQRYHHRVRAAADSGLHAQVERSGGAAADPLVAVHTADGDGLPDHAIVSFVHDQHIDLLVLGTVARHGLAGALLGNTAERLLPQVPCSVLAVKPADFHCTVDAGSH